MSISARLSRINLKKFVIGGLLASTLAGSATSALAQNRDYPGGELKNINGANIVEPPYHNQVDEEALALQGLTNSFLQIAQRASTVPAEQSIDNNSNEALRTLERRNVIAAVSSSTGYHTLNELPTIYSAALESLDPSAPYAYGVAHYIGAVSVIGAELSESLEAQHPVIYNPNSPRAVSLRRHRESLRRAPAGDSRRYGTFYSHRTDSQESTKSWGPFTIHMGVATSSDSDGGVEPTHRGIDKAMAMTPYIKDLAMVCATEIILDKIASGTVQTNGTRVDAAIVTDEIINSYGRNHRKAPTEIEARFLTAIKLSALAATGTQVDVANLQRQNMAEADQLMAYTEARYREVGTRAFRTLYNQLAEPMKAMIGPEMGR